MGKTNIQQKNYMRAKALVETLEAEAERIEKAYITQHGIVNPDGSVPNRIYDIEDEVVFDSVNEETVAEIDALGLYEAREILREAENELIKYGLSIVPAKERQILSDRCFGNNGHYVHVDIRQKVIEIWLGNLMFRP